MASYLRNIVDERDIHLITEADSQIFLNMSSRLESNDNDFDYNQILRDGGAILVVDADDEEIAQIEALLNGRDTTSTSDQMDDTHESVAVAAERGQDQKRIELMEEQLQVGKREIEEVVISKDVQERTETVSDTVRRQEVEVERGGTSDAYGYNQSLNRYREDYSTRYGNSGQSFDHYSPAYELGHRLASDQQYSSYTWEQLEPSARTYWERNHHKQGAWDQFREAAQHAWQSARGSSGSRRQS